MGSIRLAVGTEWLHNGRAFRIIRQLTPHQFVAEDLKFRVEHTCTETELLTEYTAGRLVFATQSPPLSNPPQQPTEPQVVQDLSPAEQEELVRRWEALAPLTTLGRPPVKADFLARAEQLSVEGKRCSYRSLQRYYHKWSTSGGHRLALLPSTTKRGGRGRVHRRSFWSRYPLVRRFIDEAITAVYLTTARRSMASVTRRVLEDLQRHNARVSAAQAIPVPRQATLHRAVSRKISRLDPWEVDRARWGRQIADRRHQPTSPQRLATRILERVEIDHCLLKVVVGTAAGPWGQPWLTVLIDYYSRMIVGFCLGFEPPSYAVTMEALRQAILPKTYVHERYPGITGTWPCYGIPEKLVCDRGSDLTSKDLEQAAFQLGFVLNYMPGRSPHLKGTVESFFGGLQDQLLSSLPGATFRNWERRGDYDPDAGPLLPYVTLVEVIHRHLVDVYSCEKHPTTAQTRLEMWQESAAEFPPTLPASPEELLVLLSKTTERTLSNRGIELDGMFYTSDELMALRAELAVHNQFPDKLTIRYNPWDLGSVWVLNPLDRRYLSAPSVDAALQGMTAYQWRITRRAIRERFDDPDRLLSLAAARNSLRDVVDEAIQKPSRKRRSRAARFLQPQPAARLPDSAAEFVPLKAISLDPPSPIDDTRIAPAVPLAEDIDPDHLNVDDWDVAS